MAKKICIDCEKLREHYGKGRCHDCWRRAYQRGRWSALRGEARQAALKKLRDRMAASRARSKGQVVA